jgi:hypothetical protein
MLIEYTKLDKLDLVMVIQIEGGNAKYCLMSEDWVKNNQFQTTCGSKSYIV